MRLELTGRELATMKKRQEQQGLTPALGGIFLQIEVLKNMLFVSLADADVEASQSGTVFMELDDVLYHDGRNLATRKADDPGKTLRMRAMPAFAPVGEEHIFATV